ncbi:MAG: AMIN domain-containing protein, partial [Acidobacteriaceae bacterium]
MRSTSIPMPARLLSSSACRRGVFPAVVAVAFALLSPPAVTAHRHAAHDRRPSHPALTPFARAEHLRDALESQPESSRTRNQYEHVLDAYRSVYHGNPADPKAPEAANMVAGLLAEEGRIFRRDKTLLDAVGQFEFLRTQYPVSSYRAPALLAEATIFLHDLHDPAAAKAAYLKFLSSYPRHPLAAQARAGLKEIEHQKRRTKSVDVPADDIADDIQPPEHPSAAKVSPSRTSTTVPPVNQPLNKDQSAGQRASASSGMESAYGVGAPHENELTPLQPRQAVTNAGSDSTAIASQHQPSMMKSTRVAAEGDAAEGQPVLTGAVRTAAQEHHGALPLVTNVRHWSTPVYTRVAIDLQDQVQYEAARVPNPDRIYFDLHGTRGAPELIGRTVDVTDDGFLQRIRVAQFSNDVTRIVLDVNQVTEYSAFFLPNPWRLIIDIHGGGRPGSKAQQIASAPPPVRVPASNIPQQ